MPVREIKTRLAIDGEAAYKKALADIYREQRVLNSEMKAATAAFADNAKGADALTAKNKGLAKQIEQQKVIVNSLSGAVEDASQKYQAGDKRIDDYRIQLNNAQAALNRMEAELRQNDKALNEAQQETQQTAAAVNKLGDETVKTEKKTHDFSGAMNGMKGMLKGAASGILGVASAIGAAAAAAGAAALGIGKAALESAGEMQQLADTTGRTAEELQIMKYQGANLGVELDTMTGAQSKLTKSMDTARDQLSKYSQSVKEHEKNHKKAVRPLGEMGAAYKALGVKVTDSKGQLRDSNTVMQEAITALGKVKNETERDALAMQIFGKSAMELNPLIKAGGDELQRLADEAMKTGAVMSNDAVAGLDSFGDSMDSLKQSVTGIAGTLLNSLMPTLNPIINGLKGLAATASEAAKTGDWTGFIDQAVGMVEGIATTITGMLPTFIEVGTKILTTLINALVEAIPIILPQLATAIVTLVQAITTILATNGPALITAAVNALGTLIQGLLSALPMLLQAAIQIVLALVQGIAAQLPTLIPAAVECVLTLVETLVENLPMLIDVAIQLILALVDGVIEALPKIISAAPRIITALVNGIVNALPKLIDAAINIIVSLQSGIIGMLPELIPAAINIILTLVAGILENIPTLLGAIPKLFTETIKAFKKMNWGKMGQDLINGLVEGLKSVGGRIWEALKSIVTGAVESFKNFFGIHSPADYTKPLGGGLGGGIVAGIIGQYGAIKSAMIGVKNMLNIGKTSMMMAPEFTGSYAMPAPAMAGAGTGYAGHSGAQAQPAGSFSVNVTGPFYVRNDADIKLVAQEIHRQGNDKLRALGVKQ